MKKQRPILMFLILALLGTVSLSNAQVQPPSEARLKQILKRFPQADTNKDGKLTVKEFEAARKKFRQSLQGNARPAQTPKASIGFDSGWEENEFPRHSVSLKTPEEIMAIYKRARRDERTRGQQTLCRFPNLKLESCIVGTGHSFTGPGYRTCLPLPARAGFEQPLC